MNFFSGLIFRDQFSGFFFSGLIFRNKFFLWVNFQGPIFRNFFLVDQFSGTNFPEEIFSVGQFYEDLFSGGPIFSDQFSNELISWTNFPRIWFYGSGFDNPVDQFSGNHFLINPNIGTNFP